MVGLCSGAGVVPFDVGSTPNRERVWRLAARSNILSRTGDLARPGAWLNDSSNHDSASGGREPQACNPRSPQLSDFGDRIVGKIFARYWHPFVTCSDFG